MQPFLFSRTNLASSLIFATVSTAAASPIDAADPIDSDFRSGETIVSGNGGTGNFFAFVTYGVRVYFTSNASVLMGTAASISQVTLQQSAFTVALLDKYLILNPPYKSHLQDQSTSSSIVDGEASVLSRAKSLLQREQQVNRVLQLLVHHEGLTPPAVLLAKSGSGKSTFVAQLVSRLRKQIQSGSSGGTAQFDIVRAVFAGSTAGSTSLYRVLRELCESLKAELPDEANQVIPDDILSLGSLLSHFLNALADGGKRVLLCVDAVNELEGPVARSLSWLPTHSKATVLLTRSLNMIYLIDFI